MDKRCFKLDGISIRNFRGIRKADLKDFSDINIFIGRNGSGKSTLLEAIYLVSSFADRKDALTSEYKTDIITKRRVDHQKAGVNKDVLWYNLETENPIQITLFFTSGRKMKLEMYSHVAGGRLLMNINEIKRIIGVQDIFTHFDYSDATLFNVNTGESSVSALIKNEFFNEFRDEIKILSSVLLIDERLMRHPEIMEQKIWFKILSKRFDKKIIKIIQQAYEKNAEDLSYVPVSGSYYLVLKLHDTVVRLDDLGDGIRIAIILAAYLLLANDTIVLIEDPETHQHPGGLLSILDFIVEIAKTNNLQIFMTTHSLELIQIVQKIAEKKKIGLKIFFIEREDGVVNARGIEAIDLDIIRDLGIDPRFLDVF